MTTTLSDLIDLCEADLADSGNATWSAADVEQWLRDAIADYSIHFPRVLSTTIATSADDRTYDLPADFLEPLTVEYPTGEDPPEYLKRRGYTHPDFWEVDGYFTIVHRGDDTDVDELWISEEPDDAETITVIYKGKHDNTIDAGDNLTVPARHHYLLRYYVQWQARLQLQIAEEKSPTSNSSLIMAQLSSNAQRAKRVYLDALSKAIFAETKSGPVSWQGQAQESSRIY
jgi:hypothetical protein